MLPKDLLKYAKKFSPEEINKAIIDAISRIGKSTNLQGYIELEVMRIQQKAMRMARIGPVLQNPSTTTYTRTNAIGTQWTPTYTTTTATVPTIWSTYYAGSNIS